MGVIIVIALMFGLCFLVDKGFTKLFRSKAQHRSGLSVRQNKRYASVGLPIFAIGLAAVVTAAGNKALLIGGIILAVLGIGLVVFYLSFGIYYDEDGFLMESFGRKPKLYRYGDIVHQQRYVLQGGGTIVELHMKDGSAVQIVSIMPDYDKFLDFAFACWCRAKGLDPESCPFHDPANSCWFPEKEGL